MIDAPPILSTSLRTGATAAVALTDHQAEKRAGRGAEVAAVAVAVRNRQAVLADLDRAEEREIVKAAPDAALLARIAVARRHLGRGTMPPPDLLGAIGIQRT